MKENAKGNGSFRMRNYKCFIFPTLRCLSVKTTGWVRNTLLDSLLMDAAITWELTTRRLLSGFGPSISIFTVAFSVERKDPKFLYRMKTTLTCPANRRKTAQLRESGRNKTQECVRTHTHGILKWGRGESVCQIQKWGHNMGTSGRMAEIESGEWQGEWKGDRESELVKVRMMVRTVSFWLVEESEI